VNLALIYGIISGTAQTLATPTLPLTARLSRQERAMPQSITARFCWMCGQPIPPGGKADRKYCSKPCRYAAQKQQYLKRTGLPQDSPKISAGSLGALHELVAATDLIRRGYHVFRALSPACPCDLVVMLPDRVIRVEVRTGRVLADGSTTAPTQGTYDVLAVVTHSGKVEYRPDFTNQLNSSDEEAKP
jgi:predicted nucleic acid-binding Zn ribbon protein